MPVHRHMHIYTQLAVSDLDTSLAFYRQLLGLTEHRRDVCLDPQLTRVYIGFAGTPQPDALCLVWHADHAAARDCLCHFGHLAVVVDNVTHICNRASQLGHFVISMPTSANVAYLQDPDGYAIKLVQAGEHP